jgi:hypothetical protein
MTAAVGGAFVADIVGGGFKAETKRLSLDSAILWRRKDDTNGLKTGFSNTGPMVLNPRLGLKITLHPVETDSPSW